MDERPNHVQMPIYKATKQRLMLSFITGLLLTMLGGYLYISDAQRFPLRVIKVKSTFTHITPEQIQTILTPLTQKSFFFLPISQMGHHLMTLDWVEQVRLTRHWPDTLTIFIQEKTPIAHWNEALLSTKGDLFGQRTQLDREQNLPFLYGPPDNHQEVLQVYQKMSNILKMCQLKPSALTKRPNGAWMLTLVNNTVLYLGKYPLTLRLKRFCQAYVTILASKSQQITHIDLRYPHGMAVKWKSEIENHG
ncbi:MAG TPA: cell division protein FtsQ [Legionellales bacterium]|nr:cell division protein FtsQ [Legionellales bacterium]HCA89498.1 cell division protein FtsQ [Legionellales bacterium]|tara:strand:- start:1372 stop:2118 length:747 start_codon:yes stop_codon:yes gene_type:complete